MGQSPTQNYFDVMGDFKCLIIKHHIRHNPQNLTDYEEALKALEAKAISHIWESILLLRDRDALAESIILLRAAYEATMVFLYLIKVPEDFNKYRAYSNLVHYRNYLEVEEFRALTWSEDDLSSMKQNLVKGDFLKEFGLSFEDLEPHAFLRNRKFKKAHFRDFPDIVKKVRSEYSSILELLGFNEYNVASQVAHSHYVNTYDLQVQKKHSLMPKTSVLQSIELLFVALIEGLFGLNWITNKEQFLSERNELGKQMCALRQSFS